MTEASKTVFLLEPEIFSKRILLRILKEKGFEVITFETFAQLTEADTPHDLSAVFVAFETAFSLTALRRYFDKLKSKFPDLLFCIIANDEIGKFPCVLKRPLQANFTERKLTTEFFKQIYKPHESLFDFVGVALAASTGGPLTLQHYFSKLPFTEKAAFFMVLHAPAWMLESYATRLNKASKYRVMLAENNMNIAPGRVYIAPGDFHMILDPKTRKIKLTKDEPYNFLRPAADPMFFSVADVFGRSSLAILFTGMGRDGSLGTGKIKAVGGASIVQSPDTAVIHSMPQSVIELGLADKVVDIEKLPAETIKFVNKLYAKI